MKVATLSLSIRLFAATIGLLAASIFIWPAAAQAAFGDLPTRLPQQTYQYINLTNSNINDAGGGANVPQSVIKIYAKDNGAKSLNINLVNRAVGPEKACQGIKIIFTITNSSGSYIPPYTMRANSCDGNPDEIIPIPAGALVPTNLLGHEGLYEAVITMRLDDPNGTKTPTFTIDATNGARLGYANRSVSFGGSNRSVSFGGSGAVNTYPSANGSTASPNCAPVCGSLGAGKQPPKNHIITAKFKPQCNTAARPETIFWLDDDYGEKNQDKNLTARVYEAPQNGGAPTRIWGDGYSPVVYSSQSTSGPRKGFGYIDFDVRPGYRYELFFQNVWGGNGISIYYPADSANYELPCPLPDPDPDVECTAVQVNVPPGWPANSVKAGQPFSATVTFHNLHTNFYTPNTYMGGGLSATLVASAAGNWYGPPPLNRAIANYANQNIPAGGYITVNVPLQAPNVIGAHTLNLYSDYYGVKAMGACPVPTIKIYDKFMLTPSSTMPPGLDPEERRNIPFNAGIREGSSPPQLPKPVTATTFRSFTVTRGGADISPAFNSKVNYDGSNPETREFQPGFGYYTWPNDGYNDTGNPASLLAGDVYCINILINRHKGYIGPGDSNDVIPVETRDKTAEYCSTVVDRPYVRAYGADVFAGGYFDSTPAGPLGAGFIKAYTRKNSEYGSGVEFAAFALGDVEGFASDNQRNPPIRPLSGLTFASPPSFLGGKFAGTRIVTDYYTKTRQQDLVKKSTGTINLNSGSPFDGAVDGEQQWVNPGGTPLNLSGSDNYKKRHTLYVEGDVVIQADNKYMKAEGLGWSSIADIPNFTLIVKGNIYINKSVEQLDGLYVAQPLDGGAKGKIYTCTDNAGAVPGTNSLYVECNKKLKINGALIAQDIKFLRTKGTLSERGASPDGSYPKETFFPPNPPNTPFNNEDKAAESINMGPEIYLSYPIFKREGSQSNGKYDYFVSLPPIL